ncbi:MAG: hypothetical protein B6D77_08485 [gamma proteobacterium symbiont of Ctena orbiculata]|nr:MAG: hypothetical protein B6D77_08485 [gamma proteobacterium symbiont of Ctena orbiculata]PVV25105.1 MAG: hypothetical protein B6D78_00700 [gamma proteobacterium symbiont of Ctena orbiculata]
MNRRGKKYTIGVLFLGLISSANLKAALSGEALLDLATCYGVGLPADKFQEGRDKDPRIRNMEQTLSGIRTMTDVKRAEEDTFYTPKKEIKILGNPLHYFGLKGFGPLRGFNIVLGGGFDAVKKAMEERGVEYTRCDSESKLHLKVCHQDITGRYGHVIMTHPQNPKRQMILICVTQG